MIRTSTLTATSTTATSTTATRTTLSTSTTGTSSAPVSSGAETTNQDWSSSLWSSFEAVVVACFAMAASFVVIWSCGQCSRSNEKGKDLPSEASEVKEVPAASETSRQQMSL